MKTIREFSRMVAASYNDYLARVAPGHHPKMHNAIDEAYLGLQFAEWSLDSDSTIEVPNRGGTPCKFLLSSSFSSFLGSLVSLQHFFKGAWRVSHQYSESTKTSLGAGILSFSGTF